MMSSANPPRVLLVSLRELENSVSHASAYEFEDTICAVDDVDLAAIRRLPPRQSRLEQRVLARLRKSAGVSVSRAGRYSTYQVDRDYDVAFVRVMSPTDLAHLEHVHGWKERCRVRVCWIEELWVDWLQYRSLLEPLRHFDHVFLGHASTPEPLSKIIGRPCSHLAPGVDALRFCPYPEPPLRTIDVWGMGRRAQATHAHLLSPARQRPTFFYMYDSARPTTLVEGHVQHREQTASLVKRTRYFVVNRAKANASDQTKGQQEFGPRYFEGAAAGASLVGDAPTEGVFSDYFDWPDALFRVPYGSTELVPLIEELDAQPERVEQARRTGVANVLRRHDWSQRWAQVLETIGLEETAQMAARRARLEGRAAALAG